MATTGLFTEATTGRSNPVDVDTGFLLVYGPENQNDAQQQELEATLENSHRLSDAQQHELQQIFAETYLEYCYPWCPVLDIDRLSEDTWRSPLLANALALAGSHIRPPLIPHDGPASYYKKATAIFYDDEEAAGVATLQAISLFYWWAPRPPTVAHRHSSWWWTSVLIRHAQHLNFHWVSLCAIMGRIARSLSRASTSASSPTPSAAFPSHLRQELIDWVHSLPPHLQLPIGSSRRVV
jgi:hypothetical protein